MITVLVRLIEVDQLLVADEQITRSTTLAGGVALLLSCQQPSSKGLAAAASEGLFLRMSPFMALDLKRMS